MAACVVCGHREGSEKCPACGGDVCRMCVRDGLCWNCWNKRREDAQKEQAADAPQPAQASSHPVLAFQAHLNTGLTVIEGTLSLDPDRVRFSPSDISEIAKAQYALDIPTSEVESCSQTFTTATLVNGFCIHLVSEERHTFVCDNAQATFEEIARFLANRPGHTRAAGNGHKAVRSVRGVGGRLYRCPQCEEENAWSEMICVHCNCPLPAHSLLTTLEILYSDQPCLIVLIALLIGMGLLAVITRMVVR